MVKLSPEQDSQFLGVDTKQTFFIFFNFLSFFSKIYLVRKTPRQQKLEAKKWPRIKPIENILEGHAQVIRAIEENVFELNWNRKVIPFFMCVNYSSAYDRTQSTICCRFDAPHTHSLSLTRTHTHTHTHTHTYSITNSRTYESDTDHP